MPAPAAFEARILSDNLMASRHMPHPAKSAVDQNMSAGIDIAGTIAGKRWIGAIAGQTDEVLAVRCRLRGEWQIRPTSSKGSAG